MSRRAQENIAAAIFLLVFLGAILLSLDFGPRARMIPLPLAVLGAILSVVQLVWQNLAARDALKIDLIRMHEPDAAQRRTTTEDVNGARSAERVSLRRQAGAYGIVAGLLAMTLLVGPLAAVFVFTLGYFLATRYYSPLRALVHTLIFAATIYLVFFVALQIQPYHGLLAPLLAHFE